MNELSFQEKLASIRASACEQLPTPELAVVARTIARLRRQSFNRTCLQVGETVPDFEFIDHRNAVRRFYDVLERGPAVLNFFRGYWCAYCRTELEAYESIQPVLESLGCTYFAISPQPEIPAEGDAPRVLDSDEVTGDSYEVICDRGNRIAHQFGIVYPLIEEEQALFRRWGLILDDESDRWELPIPATFVVRQDRTIGFAFVDVDFRARCCPDELLEQISGI